MRVVIYIRQSHDEQESLSLQRDLCMEYAARNEEWEVVRVYEDKATGLDLNRPGYRQMIANRETWDIILARSRKRIHRDLDNARKFVRKMVEAGKQAWSVREGHLTSKKSAGEWFVELVLQGMGEFESRQISERTIPGVEKAKKKGIHCGRPPTGTWFNRVRNRLEPTDWMLAIVRDVATPVSLGLGGFTMGEVRRRNPYPRGKRKGDVPTAKVIRNILASYRKFKEGELKPNVDLTEAGTHSRFK